MTDRTAMPDRRDHEDSNKKETAGSQGRRPFRFLQA
jgi:hypothetical protein